MRVRLSPRVFLYNEVIYTKGNIMSKSNKRGPKPVKRTQVILALREMKKVTSADLAVSTAYLDTLLRAGIVSIVGKTAPKGEGKGRPANLYKLSPAGQGMASAIQRNIAA